MHLHLRLPRETEEIHENHLVSWQSEHCLYQGFYNVRQSANKNRDM